MKGKSIHIKTSGAHSLLFLFLALIGLQSCSEETKEATEERPTSIHTIWTDKTELFVEYDAFVVDELSTFAAHFSNMESFKAVTEGEVTVSLIQDGKGIRQSVGAPDSPGIFKPALKPTKPGIYQLVFEIKTKAFTDRIVIENVPVYASISEAVEKHPQPEEGNTITFLKEQAWKMEFATVAVKRDTVYDIIHAGGEIVSSQGDEITLSATASGLVMYTDQQLAQGTEIVAGKQLFTISEGGMTVNNLQAEFLRAKSTFDQAKTTLERKKKLFASKAISAAEMEEAQLIFDVSASDYNNLAKNFSSGGKRIVANQSGFVKELFHKEGDFVEAGEPLAVIAKNKNLTLMTHVNVSDYPRLNPQMTANFSVNDEFYSVEDFDGKLLSYGKSVSMHSPKIPVYFLVNNRKGLIPGSYIDVWIKSSPKSQALLIPIEALLEEAGKYSVIVQLEGETFELRPITIGVSDGEMIEVKSGLKQGERVVTTGRYQVKMASMSGQLPAHGHSH